jgi:hypothetical protein
MKKHNLYLYLHTYKPSYLPTMLHANKLLHTSTYIDTYDFKRWWFLDMVILKKYSVCFGVSDRSKIGQWLIKRFMKSYEREFYSKKFK